MSTSVQLERLIKVFETLKIPRVFQSGSGSSGGGQITLVGSSAGTATGTFGASASGPATSTSTSTVVGTATASNTEGGNDNANSATAAATGSPILALVSASRSKKESAPVSRTDKLQSCSQFCECLLSGTLQNNADFPKYLSLSIEALMDLCDDSDHDVRIASDEAINKLIKSLPSSYINHLLFEFYKELKRRGGVGTGSPMRSLSLALRKFAALCRHIKASRRRSYVTSLLPCLAKLASEREEEVLLEAFREALPRLCAHLLRYATDAEVKLFLKAFLPNLHSDSITVRRTAAQLIAVICQHARGPFAFLSWTLQLLIDMLVPVDEERPMATIHGVLVALRHAATAHHALISTEEGGEANSRPGAAEGETTCRAEQWASVLELCLFYTQAKDGTVATAALEALQQLLRCPPPVLLPQLLYANGAFWRTSIYKSYAPGAPLSRTGSVSLGSLSRLPATETSGAGMAATPELEERRQLVDEVPPPAGVGSAPVMADGLALEASESSEDGPSTGTTESANSPASAEPADSDMDVEGATEADEEEEEDAPIEIPSLPPRSDAPRSRPEEAPVPAPGVSAKTLQEMPVRREGDLGQLCDPEHPPLLYCARLVAYRFLLTGHPGELLSDRLVRVSLKSLALSCLGQVARRAPHLLCSSVLKTTGSAETKAEQLLTDAFKYCRHDDPQVCGQAAFLVASFIEAVFRNSYYASDYQSWLRTVWDWEGAYQEPPRLEELLEHFTGHFFAASSNSNATLHRALVALRIFAGPALVSPGSAAPHILALLERCLGLADNKYRLVRTALLDLFRSLDFTQVHYAEAQVPSRRGQGGALWRLEPLQERVLRVVCGLACEEDREVSRAAVECLAALVPKLYFPSCTASSSGCVTGMERRLLCLTLATRHCPTLLRSLMSPQVWGHSAPPAPLFGTAPMLDMSPWRALEMAEKSGLSGGAAFEANLQHVLHRLRPSLATACSKEEVVGRISALNQLARTYPPCWHPFAWSTRPGGRSLSPRECPFRAVPGDGREVQAGGQDLFLLEHCVCLLTSSPHVTDQVFHQELLSLSGQLLVGFGLSHLIKAGLDDEKKALSQPQPPAASAVAALSPDLGRLLSALLRHVVRLLCIFTHVIDDQTPAPPPEKKLVLPNPLAPPSALSSPVRAASGSGGGRSKQRPAPVASGPGPAGAQLPPVSGDSGKESAPAGPDKEKEEKSKSRGGGAEAIGQFYTLAPYMRLYESIRTAFKSYRISFELTKSDRTVRLLETCLDLFCQLLELSSLSELTKAVEEVLQYLRSVYPLLPVSTVRAMRQLLRALFGTNLISQWEPDLCRIYEQLQSWLMSVNPGAATDMGLTVMSHQLPYQQLSQALQSSGLLPATNSAPTASLYAWLRYSGERRQPLILRPSVGLDKATISGYIRLFEPLVILTLRDYTSTSSAGLQADILALLSQLIHLRVNYCQLDADQRFLQIVRKQCEQLEESHATEANLLAPALFNFLILLSYERVSPGKGGGGGQATLVAMPELLQLADGLLASGLDPTDAVLPVLQQIVTDLFVRRADGGAGGDELNSQREYLVSILLKLCQWPATFTPLRLVVEHAAAEGEERWHRISQQVLDTLLPIMSAGQLCVDSAVDLDTLHALLAALWPGVFRPLDQLIQMMFAPPTPPNFTHNSNGQGGVTLPRWSATILALLRTLLSHTGEESLLQRVAEQLVTVQLNKRAFASPLRHAVSSCSASSTTPEWEAQEAPETLLLRFCFQLLGLLVSRVAENAANSLAPGETQFCAVQAALLLFYLLHLFREGSPTLARMLNGAAQLCASESSRYYSVEDLNSLVFDLRGLQPYLAAQWCHLMTRLRHTDESWWSRILLSPSVSARKRGSREFLVQEVEEEEDGRPNAATLNEEVTRSLAMTYFSASVIADGSTDGEKLSWLIVRHVYEIVLAAASGDPVMQDLVSAVHRNSSASVLFLQALQYPRGHEAKWKELHLTRCVLRCVEGIHLSASGRLLALLFDRFLFTPCLALAKRAEVIACGRVEMLLLVQTDCRGQVSLDEVDAMLAQLPAGSVRFEHLRSLLSRLRQHIQPPNDPLTPSARPASPGPVSGPSQASGREWYLDRLRRHCCGPRRRAQPRLCARLLQHVDFAEALAVMARPDFQPAVLEQCFRISFVRTQGRFMSGTARFSPVSPITEPGQGAGAGASQRPAGQVDKLFEAAETVLLQRVRAAVGGGTGAAGEASRHHVTWLCAGLVQYLVVLKQLPVPVAIPSDFLPDILLFVELYTKCLPNLVAGDRIPSSVHIIDVVQFLRLLLALAHHPLLLDLLTSAPNLCVLLATTLYTLIYSGYPHELPHPSVCPSPSGGHSAAVFRARWMLGQLMRRLVLPNRLQGGVGEDFNSLRCLFHANVVSLCRLSIFNSAVRGPQSWAGSGEEEGIQMTALVDRPLLEEFVQRVVTLGWTSKKQFEEVWVSLLYPLNPPRDDLGQEDEEEELLSPAELVERSQLLLTSMWGLTRLLLDTLGRPEPGNPVTSVHGWDHRPRGKLPAFNHTRAGRRLSQVSAVLWEELEACLYGERGPFNAGCPRGYRRDWNLERQANPHQYSHEQLNLEVLRRRVQSGAFPSTADGSPPGLLDVHSCLAFVPDLFSPWLDAGGSRAAALAVRTHAVRCAVALADLCSSSEQAEWLADALAGLASGEVKPAAPAEEASLLRPALICGLAKVTAVLHSSNHAGGAPLETVAKLVEAALGGARPMMASVQCAALHAAMFLLQMEPGSAAGAGQAEQERDAGSAGLLHDLHQHVVHFLERALLVLATGADGEREMYSEAFWLTVLGAAFSYCEQLSDLLRETDLVANLILVCQQHTDCSLPIHVALFRGFERLLLTGSLPRLTVDVLVKMALDRLRGCELCPVRALPPLNLFLSCMYITHQASPDHSARSSQPASEAAEMRRLSVLERTAVLFSRMQRSAPLESRLLSRVLPHVSLDFFSPEEVLNRTLRELVLPEPLYPDLTARLVFETFRQLCQREQGAAVRRWTLLAVHNLAEMRPLERALSALSVAFLSCTENVWLRGIFHCALSRLGYRATSEDEECFLHAAVDFYRSLANGQDRETFVSTFRALAPHEETFRKLDAAIAAL